MLKPDMHELDRTNEDSKIQFLVPALKIIIDSHPKAMKKYARLDGPSYTNRSITRVHLFVMRSLTATETG
jgi:hypothetical protein